MRFFLVFGLILGFAQVSFAQVETPGASEIVSLEKGYFLEVIAAKYVTVLKSSVDIEDQPLEWITIPAVFETVTETHVVQEAYTDLDVTPAVLAEDGSVIEATKIAMKEFPAITKQVSRRAVKTPAKLVQRNMPPLCNLPQARRELVAPKVYILRDTDQVEIGRYEDPEELLATIVAAD